MYASSFDDETYLLSQLKKGDQRAFDQLYAHYSPMLFCQLKKILKSESLARELLQEVFLRIWRMREKLDAGRSLRSYLFRIAANMGCDYFRKSIREQAFQKKYSTVEPRYYCHIEEDIILNENKTILSEAIGLLPPKRRNIFNLCKLEGKSYDEVSHNLGISISTISDHIVKANHFIKSYLLKHSVK